MLGSYLLAYFRRLNRKDLIVKDISRQALDVRSSNIISIEDLFNQLSIDNSSVVINSIGLIPQAETPGTMFTAKDYLLINSIFPHHLSYLSSKYGAKMFQISTDCVFSGYQKAECSPYNEHSLCDETNFYGVSKSLGEPITSSCSVIRCSLVGEELYRGRSLLQWVLNQGLKISKNSTIQGYINHFWNGITCLQLASTIDKIISENLFWSGIRHIYSEQCISKYDLIKLIKEIYSLELDIIALQKENTINKCLKSAYPLNSELMIPDIKDQIEKMKDFNIRKKFTKS